MWNHGDGWIAAIPKCPARAPFISLFLMVTALGSMTLSAASSELWSPVEKQVAARQAELGDFTATSPVTPRTVEILLELGRVDDAMAALDRLGGDPREARRITGVVYLVRHDYEPLRPLMDVLSKETDATDGERRLLFDWLFAIDDAAQVDALTRTHSLDPGTRAPVPDLLAAGALAYDLLNYDRAESCFTMALEKAETPALRSSAIKGQGLVAYKLLDYDGSLEKLTTSIEQNATPDGLMAMAETLIRLGRTDEAIAAAEWSVRLNPYHEMGHYYLGNGYARKNYTELASSSAFIHESGRGALGRVDELLAKGNKSEAREDLERIRKDFPGSVDPIIRLASIDFELGQYDQARDLCFEALKICPEYGRAHAVLAKVLESQRFLVDVHRPDYERRFNAMPMPEVPGIEKFVLNWAALSPRHQKRVALSVAPWKQFIPVLVEGESTYYIKPLYMLLSETPGQETLRDQRINYDSRLWDDVRGCGGYHTVTGIEDVERTIFDRYNTVLHELTHQVHGILTADQSRAIQELYRKAKERDEATRRGFLSRYAGGSVWEYFAEGANGIESPKRDAYDPREIVKERLVGMDPDLEKLVKDYFAISDVSASYPVAYVNAGYDQLERGQVEPAVACFEKALAKSPEEETALQALVYGLSLKRDPRTVAMAERALKAHPSSGQVATTASEALWHSGQKLEACVDRLVKSRSTVRPEDRYQVDLALGRYHWNLGDAGQSLAAFDSALTYQADNPEALWGKAQALALAENWDRAFALYDQAVRIRTGVVGLRSDYARDLLLAGRVDQANAQLSEAALLDAEDPTAEALRGWSAMATGDWEGSHGHLKRALEFGSWCDLARILSTVKRGPDGTVVRDEGLRKPIQDRVESEAPPEYVYRPKLAQWQSVHEFPALERRLLDGGLPGVDAGSIGGSKEPAGGRGR